MVGILIGRLVVVPIDSTYATYVAVACLAGIDSICGGIRSSLENKFHADIFISGFASNVVIAFFIAWLGDKIGINLFFAAALVLGGRIFVNLSLIRRFILTKWQDARIRRAQAEARQNESAGQTVSST